MFLLDSLEGNHDKSDHGKISKVMLISIYATTRFYRRLVIPEKKKHWVLK